MAVLRLVQLFDCYEYNYSLITLKLCAITYTYQKNWEVKISIQC